MEYEIVEPLDCDAWGEELRRTRLRSWHVVDPDDMRVTAINIPESEDM